MPLLVVVESGQQYTYRIEKQEFLIGRSERADLVVTDRLASRIHASITTDGTHYFVADRNSTNGTWLNKALIDDVPTRLYHGDRVRIARTVLRFLDHEADTGEFEMVQIDDEPAYSGETHTPVNLQPLRPDHTPETSIGTRRVPFHHVFISHATEDDAFVDQLAAELQQRTGSTGWVDHKIIETGDWTNIVEMALERASVMIVVLSPHAIDSPYVKGEWNHFLKSKRPIFPLKIEDCRTPLFLNTYQVLDLTVLTPEEALKRLFVAVQDELNQINES